ncbi:hypothetical protein DFP73DRAFT_630435 [Morchella snyderi]|nr:hypothetical protein DFP73DRAFT_630435 [Morchella snyderi]
MTFLTTLSPHPFDPTHRFTTSYALPPLLLACTRLTISVYIFTYLLYRIAYSAVADGSLSTRQSFSYFTNITYWSLGFYFAVSGLHTLLYALRGRRAAWLKGPWAAAHAVWWTSVVTFPFLVTIVYWGILAADDLPFRTQVSAYSNISAHLLNSVFALFEILLTRTAVPSWTHLPFLILFLAGYLCVAYITHATQGFYTYGFLDPKTGNGMVAAYCVGIAVAICVVWAVVAGVVWVRVWLTERVLGWEGKFSSVRVEGGVEKGEVR